jgi:hypothetical protein
MNYLCGQLMQPNMKFSPGQTVLLLNTEYKPVCNAIVKNYDNETGKYEVAYQYPDPNITETLFVPQERLTLPPVTAGKV